MTWQTSKMAENGAEFNQLHQPKDKRFQYVSGENKVACAPMMDWTDYF